MTDTDKGKRVPVAEIPEVQELEDLRQEIEALKARNPDVFMLLSDLVDRYNAALEVADKAVRERGVSCGPFDNFSVAVKYDPVKMFDELGEDLFLQVGGSTTTVTEYVIDAKRVEAAIAGKKIPDECVEHFRKIEKKYHKPPKRVL